MKFLLAITMLLSASFSFAQVQPTITTIAGKNNAYLYSYRMVSSDLSTAAAQLPSYMFKTVQVTGVFGGATMTAEGSNDGTVWYALKNVASTAVSGDMTFTSAGMKRISENPRYVRLRTSSTAASTDLTGTILFAK